MCTQYSAYLFRLINQFLCSRFVVSPCLSTGHTRPIETNAGIPFSRIKLYRVARISENCNIYNSGSVEVVTSTMEVMTSLSIREINVLISIKGPCTHAGQVMYPTNDLLPSKNQILFK